MLSVIAAPVPIGKVPLWSMCTASNHTRRRRAQANAFLRGSIDGLSQMYMRTTHAAAQRWNPSTCHSRDSPRHTRRIPSTCRRSWTRCSTTASASCEFAQQLSMLFGLWNIFSIHCCMSRHKSCTLFSNVASAACDRKPSVRTRIIHSNNRHRYAI